MIKEIIKPRGTITDMAMKALSPNIATNPGLMIKVAALVILAASDKPTTSGENPLPIAKSVIERVRSAPLTTKNIITAA